MSAPPPQNDAKEDRGLPSMPPDLVEQEFPDEIDNIVPTRGYQMTPMVGLGGSAGSIQAMAEFFKDMPAESGMIFVVVLHLSPTHQSTLPELLGRSTKMPVVAATDGLKVQVNHVYVIPPGKYLATVDGHLKLTDFERERGKRVAVDLFFRSLADTHGPNGAAVVLSGADGDGALGIKRIKERGGLTIVQDPEESEYAEMPKASIDTGMIDWVLDIKDMPGRLLRYFHSRDRLRLPPEDGPQPLPTEPPSVDEGESALRDVLVFLRMRTGRDFSYYKRATILRRIGRRMQVNGVDDLPAYLSFLRTHSGEPGALLQDMLISVTNFFRDRDVFDALAKHIPKLFENKTATDLVRVWVPACATGEEAYSIAMLLLGHARTLEAPPALQVFACDLDDQAIQTARAGNYPEVITADVSEDLLRRYFVKNHQGYRVRRELREMVLFATHDLLKDSPFSRMDLISCRNLLIYLNRSAQQRALDTFHFALKPEGLLLLGSSESVDEDSALFRVIDKKHRIYAQQPAARNGLPLPSGPSTLLRALEAQAQAQEAPVVHGKRFVQDAAVPFQSRLTPALDRAALTDLHYRLIERFAPPSVIVNADHEIMHLSEHAGAFLRFAGGEPTADLLRVVDPALRVELRTALFRAAESNSPVKCIGVPVKIGGQRCAIDLHVSSAAEIGPGFLLVVFERRPPADTTPGAMPQAAPADALARHLERELEQLKAQLRNTVERFEASTEELKASNEELQAMNEELRSATEELETSREELQSINEELTTVNQEMKGKVDELAHANSDLQNLMASTAIATLFLDRDLQITRFTPSAAGIFNLIPGDVGRPLAHLKHRLDYPELMSDVEQVLRTLMPIEREVRDDSHWYFARMQPYRTVDDRIAGVVLTFVDFTERNRVTEALRKSEERLRILIESVRDYAIFTTDLERRIDTWNAAAESMFGYAENEIIGLSADILFVPDDPEKGDLARELQLARDLGRSESEHWYVHKNGSVFYGSGSVMPLRDKAGGLRGFVKIMQDLTERKRTEQALHDQMDELSRFNAAAVGRETRMIELKKEINNLVAQRGEPPRYPLESESEEGEKKPS